MSTPSSLGLFTSGDILLRSGREPDSVLIRRLAKGRFSHAGICSSGNSEKVVDAYPRGEDESVVAATAISDFFDKNHAGDGGGAYRYNGLPLKARAAARYAELQCQECFTFDIYDPILGRDLEPINNNRLYCSEFVWRCFRDGANVVLVEPAAFLNLLAPENINNTVKAWAYYRLVQKMGPAAKLVPSFVIGVAANIIGAVTKSKVKSELKHVHHNGRFVTPDQLATSTYVSLIRDIPPRRSKLVES
jgi:hypothetical protein